MDEPFLEAGVLAVPEMAVRIDRRRVVGATLSTTWSQLRSSSAVTAPVTAVAKPRPR
jgi:hypothetical protein